MTVIAGFQCFDALLMCADSEQAIGTDSKSQVRKIDSFSLGGIAVAIGGAGDADIIEYVNHQLRLKFHQNPPSRDNFDMWMESFAKAIWNSVIRPYRGFAYQEIPAVSFLVGLQSRGAYTLYQWERNVIYPVPIMVHTSIGAGITQSESLLIDLNSIYLPVHQMLLYAVRAMLRVKQLVQGCGGKTEAVLLMNDGFIMTPATRQIDAIEYLVEELDYLLLENSVGFVAGRVKTDEQKDLNDHVELLKRLKAGYERIVPDLVSWYRNGEIRF